MALEGRSSLEEVLRVTHNEDAESPSARLTPSMRPRDRETVWQSSSGRPQEAA